MNALVKKPTVQQKEEQITWLEAEIDHLRALNEELVAALQELVRYDSDPSLYAEDYGTRCLRRARAAIAKAKGEG